MKLTIAAQRLADLNVGQLGSTIFINSMPADTTQGVLLRDLDQGSLINHYLPGYIDTTFRVAARSSDYLSGLQLAWSALQALTIKGELAIGPGLVKQMLPMNEPRAYQRSVGGLWEFEVDVSIQYVRALVTASPVP